MVISIPLLQNPHQPLQNPSQGQPCPSRPQKTLLTHIPLNKGILGIHRVKRVVQTISGLSNGVLLLSMHIACCIMARFPKGTRRRLVINTNFETSEIPIHKLDATLGLDGGSGGIDIFGNHVIMVQQAPSHVFTMVKVTFHHLVEMIFFSFQNFLSASSKHALGDLCYRKLFMWDFSAELTGAYVTRGKWLLVEGTRLV